MNERKREELVSSIRAEGRAVPIEVQEETGKEEIRGSVGRGKGEEFFPPRKDG
jgi:hypothetical protein